MTPFVFSGIPHPDTADEIALAVVLVFGAIVFVFAALMTLMTLLVVTQILGFSKAKARYRTDRHDKNTNKVDAWARRHGFQWAGIYQILGVRFALWYHAPRSTVLIQYLLPRPVYEMGTDYADFLSLSSATNYDAVMIPFPPGMYQQVFPQAGLDVLLARHLEAERFLLENGAREVPENPLYPWPPGENDPAVQAWVREQTSAADDGNPYAHRENLSAVHPLIAARAHFVGYAITLSVRMQARYVRSLWCWAFRWPYWYFRRRYAYSNKTVGQLTAAGKFQYPRELPFDYDHWAREAIFSLEGEDFTP